MVDVALVRWPEEAGRRDSLLARGQPIVWLVSSGPLPVVSPTLEDWVRMPASPADIEARIQLLQSRTREMFQSGSGERPHPYVDDDGLLRFGPDWVSLSPVESQLVGVLLETPGAVVPRQMMIKAGWPHLRESEAGPNRSALDAHVLRLRRRLKGIGLTVRTIRSRGYILDVISKASDETEPEPGL